MVKKISIKLLKLVLYFIAFVLLYVLSAFIISRIDVDQEPNAPDELDVYILTNGVHTDIVVPSVTDQINWFDKMDHLGPNIDRDAYRYLAIGWGDKGFYLNTPTWAELKASTALKAVIGVSGTAIHATYYPEMIENERCKKIRISKEQYGRLIKYIIDSLDKTTNNEFIKIQTTANKSEFDAFYEATGRYSLFNTCNSWTNNSLKASGQKACLWTAFQNPIFLNY